MLQIPKYKEKHVTKKKFGHILGLLKIGLIFSSQDYTLNSTVSDPCLILTLKMWSIPLKLELDQALKVECFAAKSR